MHHHTFVALRWLPILLALALAVGLAVPLRAQDASGAGWEQTGLAEPASRLSAPMSGSLFATTPGGLNRSDDGGDSWWRIELPPEVQVVIAVDPTNHSVLYGNGAEGLYKSTDDGATWRRISRRALGRLTISPANPDLLYTSEGLVYERSRDGGMTWEEVNRLPTPMVCQFTAPILMAHPDDEQRVFRSVGCLAGRNFYDGIALEESASQGQSWTTSHGPFRSAKIARRLWGRPGSATGRLYLHFDAYGPGGVDELLKRDGDAPWTVVFRGEGPSALDYDPAEPDRVYAVLDDRLKASTDGGSTWTDLEHPDFGRISDVLVGIDSANLYAATETGVWRLRLR